MGLNGGNETSDISLSQSIIMFIDVANFDRIQRFQGTITPLHPAPYIPY